MWLLIVFFKQMKFTREEGNWIYAPIETQNGCWRFWVAHNDRKRCFWRGKLSLISGLVLNRRSLFFLMLNSKCVSLFRGYIVYFSVYSDFGNSVVYLVSHLFLSNIGAIIAQMFSIFFFLLLKNVYSLHKLVDT